MPLMVLNMPVRGLSHPLLAAAAAGHQVLAFTMGGFRPCNSDVISSVSQYGEREDWPPDFGVVMLGGIALLGALGMPTFHVNVWSWA